MNHRVDVLGRLRIHVVVKAQMVQVLRVQSARPPKRETYNCTFRGIGRLAIL